MTKHEDSTTLSGVGSSDVLGCDGILKIIEMTDNFLYCRYVCNKCGFDSWHTMSATAHRNHVCVPHEPLVIVRRVYEKDAFIISEEP